ncbi:MAG TPA: hypothetical protein DCZ40_12380 [Lachnospiraceae bacterium]|nr:hypothetical protein [Lachnospiraceae bacterium]
MLFRCENCGGNVIYSPEKGKMYCPHCDGIDSGKIEGTGIRTECVNCGAPLEIKEYNSTCRCGYCGSYIILDERVEGEYKPHLVLPFKIGRKYAVELLKNEFKSRIFTPGTFLEESTLEEMKGMYVPFWLYDYKADIDYSGKGTKVRVWSSGNTEYTETSYFRVKRNMGIDFRKVPADASIEMPDDVMDLMEPFEYNALEEFQEKYLSGFYGEIYNEGADKLEERAYGKVQKDADSLLMETLGGYTSLVPEHKNIRLDRKDVSYTLLPVWRYLYKYQGKDYPFYVNGQTGKVIGATPVSRKKVIVYSGTVLAAVWTALAFFIGILEIL